MDFPPNFGTNTHLDSYELIGFWWLGGFKGQGYRTTFFGMSSDVLILTNAMLFAVSKRFFVAVTLKVL